MFFWKVSDDEEDDEVYSDPNIGSQEDQSNPASMLKASGSATTGDLFGGCTVPFCDLTLDICTLSPLICLFVPILQYFLLIVGGKFFVKYFTE